MVESWSDGGRPMVGTAEGYAAGLGDFTVTRQRVPALQFRSLGERLAPEVGARRSDSHQIRGWHAGTDINLMGCKSPDPNRPFGDLAGGRVGGVSRRLK